MECYRCHNPIHPYQKYGEKDAKTVSEPEVQYYHLMQEDCQDAKLLP